MAHQDIEQTARVEVRYSLAGEPAMNVFHAKAEDVITVTELDDLAALFTTWINDSWKPIASSDWYCTQLIITDMTSINGARRAYPFPGAGINGLLAEEAMPANCTLAVKADVGIRGRGKNGRTFWIGLSEPQVEIETVTTTAADSITGAMEDLRTLIAGATNWAGLAIPHLVVGGVRPPLAQADLVLSYHLADLIVDSQRDRLPGHRRHKKRTP